jgi:hypothetical protein
VVKQYRIDKLYLIGRDYGFGLSHKTNIFIKGKYRESTQKENHIGGVIVSILGSNQRLLN